MQRRHDGASRRRWVLYLYQRPRKGEALDYIRERESMLEAIERTRGAGIHLEIVEMGGPGDARRALLRRAYDLVIVAGHGPDFGLCGGATRQVLIRHAPVLAEQFAATCRPGAVILLLGCCTSWLGPALAERGLRGIAFDGHLRPDALLAFLGGYVDGVCARLGFRRCFEEGCRSMALEHLDTLSQARSFGADTPADGRYVWILEPFPLEELDP